MRYRLIDLSRSVAALIVVVYHWNLYMLEQDWASYAPGGFVAPYSKAFDMFYNRGGLAVQYFWMLSGFIFAHVYRDTQIGFTQFVGRRLARLYPLHFVTLLATAMLQAILVWLIGATLLYPFNDFYHFVLHLFFISAWGFAEGVSFNGPVWSVSVEIPVYIMFWAVIRTLPLSALSALTISLAFFLLQRVMTGTEIDTCAMLFFFGVATFHASRWLTSGQLLVFGIAACGAWPILFALVPALNEVASLKSVLMFAPILAIIAALDQLSETRSGFLDRCAKIGDLSYSIYLLHTPLMLLLIIGMLVLGIDRSTLAGDFWPLAAFIVVTITISQLSLNKLEVPARRWFRHVVSPKQKIDDMI